MTQSEIKALVLQPEVLEYLKANIILNLNVNPCTNIMGYDIKAVVKLHGKTLQRAEDCI